MMKEQYVSLTKKIEYNTLALNGAFFKVPACLNIHPGFIIENQLKNTHANTNTKNALSLHCALLTKLEMPNYYWMKHQH